MPRRNDLFFAGAIAVSATGILIALSPQVRLASAIAASVIGAYIALSPPNPDQELVEERPDIVYFLAVGFIRRAILAPFVLSAVHTCLLAYYFPDIPGPIYRYGQENHLNTGLITWSAATSVPLFLIFCVGLPCRLFAYAGLGRNFTFALKEPDHLVTDGIYRYLQHPSYPGTFSLAYGISILVFRIDGALSCWIHPEWYYLAEKMWWWGFAPMWFIGVPLLIWLRVKQEESMLRATLGAQWEAWHARTARFIPGIF